MICLWYRSHFRHKKAGWLHTFLSFFPELETSKLSAVVSLLPMEALLPNTSLLLNTLRKK